MRRNRLIRSDQFRQQPKWFTWFNKSWEGSYSLGTRVNLEKESLIKAAKQATGFSDFGMDFWEEPLEVMLESINKEARLHPIGRFITRQRIINLLSVRLRAEHYFKTYPEILEQELYPCLLVIGLQRTGTTKLQRLLAADPDNRSLISWEALNPAPVKGDIRSGRKRIKIAKTSVKALKLMSPGFFAIHPIEFDAPEEDVLLLDVSFLSTTTEATMNVPTYAAWLENNDQSPAYAYMVKLLKLLQWQRPGKRWVLKTPHHLEFLPLAKKYFGDVQFIWTHRDVRESIPSFLSMVAYSRVLFSSEVATNDVATQWVRKNGHMLSKAMTFRQDQDHEKFFTDVSYPKLLANPFKVMENIYAARGEKISKELMADFQKTNLKNPKGKYGNHHYDLLEFGIDHQYLHHFTADYQEYQQVLGVLK